MKLILIALSLTSVQALASVKTITCESQDGLLYNQFSGSAVVTLNEDDNTVEAVLNFTTTSPGQQENSITGQMKGTFKDYEGGVFGKDPAQSIQLLDKDGDVSTVLLNTGIPGTMTSTIIANGGTYKSACK